MGHASPIVPAHLRRFVVEQDYDQYSAIDQAVWRFVLLQTYSRLVETAHPTYRRGLAATGISVDSIPRIAEMNERLSRFGWGAVCVDGFIPPRAFQEFQAHGLLPIAADIRSHQHLAYTPAPDIIHEAAGHAPILPDPVYAAFLKRIGALGAQAFNAPEEDRVFRAIHDLSEAKEDPSCGRASLARVEGELATALASVAEPSEASRLSRLYWWTAEYGLVGTADDYKIYGAGLLSSLGESNSCHAPEVRKLPLDERCMEVSYDITRPQPQLFVAPSFEALHQVLDRAERRLMAERQGGVALERALRSEEVATVQFSSGACAMGTLQAAGPRMDSPAWLSFVGRTCLAWAAWGAWGAWEGKLGPTWSADPPIGLAAGVGGASDNGAPGCAEDQIVLTGPLAAGSALAQMSDAALDACRDRAASGDVHVFRFASGAVVEGRLERRWRTTDGRLCQLDLCDVRLSLPTVSPRMLPRFTLWPVGEITSIRAGAVDDRFHPATAPSLIRIPRPRHLSPQQRRLLSLYQEAQAASRLDAAKLLSSFSQVHAALSAAYPDEWLLRWNLLENLTQKRGDNELTRTIRRELETLEERFAQREPIASGLRYLESLPAA